MLYACGERFYPGFVRFIRNYGNSDARNEAVWDPFLRHDEVRRFFPPSYFRHGLDPARCWIRVDALDTAAYARDIIEEILEGSKRWEGIQGKVVGEFYLWSREVRDRHEYTLNRREYGFTGVPFNELNTL